MHSKRFTVGDKKLNLLPVDDSVDVGTFIASDAHEIYRDLNDLAHRRIKWLMPTG